MDYFISHSTTYNVMSPLVVLVVGVTTNAAFYDNPFSPKSLWANRQVWCDGEAWCKTDDASMPIWPGMAPGERSGAIGDEFDTCLTKGVNLSQCVDISVHNVTTPTLTPYLVAGADSAVVVAPGGGYSILAIDREGTDIAKWLNSIGVSAFLLKYRVPERDWLPFGAAPLMDAQRAMGLVRQMIDDGKVALR